MSLVEISQAIVSHLNLLLVFFAMLCDQLRPTLCDPVDGSPLGSSVHGIFQARILEWVAISFSRDLPGPGIEPPSPALADRFNTTEPPGKR